MSSLPEEIYLDILLRVSAKSTFVCKCVCKSWFSLISNPDFVKSHLNRTTQTNNRSLLIQSGNTYLRYDSSSSSSSSNESDDVVVVELDFLYKPSKLMGSCNGLVYGWNNQFKFFFMWNPATKECKRLPRSDTLYKHLGGYHGFGYDHKTDDYKLVKIYGIGGTTFVQVYSLISNSWKSFQSTQYEVRSAGVLLNGVLHWFGVSIGKHSKKIILMDISDERFEELQLPMTLPICQDYMNMGVLDECLCVLAKFEGSFQVWVMSNYGVTESWTKLHTITYMSIMCNCCWYDVELIGSFKNGEILFGFAGEVISYDSNYGTARKIEVDNIPRGGAVKYFESLVSLNSNTQ